MDSVSPQILVIEDEPCVQELLRDVLEPEGFTIVSVSHPDDLHPEPGEKEPDLIIVDLMLPARNGVQVASDLRAKGFGHTPMVAISASRLMLHLAHETGLFQTTLSKPFELSSLIRCVQHYASRYVV